jgi:hypothetical protein
MYIGSLFRYSYRYLLPLTDQIFIISAKYGLLKPDTFISPYDCYLTEETEAYREEWTRKCISQIRDMIPNYVNERYILAAFGKYRRPFCGLTVSHPPTMGLGKLIHYYKGKPALSPFHIEEG